MMKAGQTRGQMEEKKKHMKIMDFFPTYLISFLFKYAIREKIAKVKENMTR